MDEQRLVLQTLYQTPDLRRRETQRLEPAAQAWPGARSNRQEQRDTKPAIAQGRCTLRLFLPKATGILI
jgi:hypothetical protein